MSVRSRRLVSAGLLTATLFSASLSTGPAGAEDQAFHERHPADPVGRSFQRLATFPVFRHSADPATETVAEITAVSPDSRTLISTDSAGERVLFTDLRRPGRPTADGSLAVGGEPTSVAVYRSYALIAVDTSESFTAPSGELLVVSLADRTVRRRIDLGGQPDSVAISPAGSAGGTYAAVAIENQRDEDVNDGELPRRWAGSWSP